MPRTRDLSVPGEVPADEVAEAQNPIVDADGLVVGTIDPGLTNPPSAGKAATVALRGTPEEQIAAMRAQMADLQQLVNDQAKLIRGVVPQRTVAAVAALPTVEEVTALQPNAPTQTRDGWYVPRVTTANPEQLATRVAQVLGV